MRIYIFQYFYIIFVGLSCLVPFISSITMQQFEQSLEMMRNGCAPKFKVQIPVLDKVRVGDFSEVDKEVMCYVRCVAQLAGTLTKKGDFSVSKAVGQIPFILPPELQETAKEALNACKDVQKPYKDSCERVFYTTKCVAEYAPASFKFP